MRGCSCRCTVQLNFKHGITAHRQGVGAAAQLAIAVNVDSAGDQWKRRQKRNALETCSWDVEVNGVCAGSTVGADDRLAKRARSRIIGVDHGEGCKHTLPLALHRITQSQSGLYLTVVIVEAPVGVFACVIVARRQVHAIGVALG